jgi:hypothetical protein
MSVPAPPVLSSLVYGYIRHKPLSADQDFSLAASQRSYSGYTGNITADNITLTNVRIRPGRDAVDASIKNANEVDCFRIFNRNGVTLQNCSGAWATDENFSIGESIGCVVNRCISAEGLKNAGHPSGDPANNHSCGLLASGFSTVADYTPCEVSECLFASNNLRSPNINAVQGYGAGQVCFVVKNNVSYNPGKAATRFDVADSDLHASRVVKVDYVGNLIIPGPQTDLDAIAAYFMQANYANVYYADNYIWINGSWTDWSAWAAARVGESELGWKGSSNFSTTHESDPDTVYQTVLQNAGAFPRDQHDRRIVDEVVNGRGATPKYPPTSHYLPLPANTPDIASGITHRWMTAGNATDTIAGSSFNFSGNESTVAGLVGTAVTIANGEQVNAGDVSDLDIGSGDSFSVAFWVKCDVLPDAISEIIYKKSGRSTNAGWMIYATPAGTVAVKLADGSESSLVSHSGVLAADTWAHVGFTLNRDTDTASLFFDGDLVGDIETGDSVSLVGSLANAQNFTVGDTDSSSTWTFNDIRTYNRVLTWDDIRSLYRFREGSVYFQSTLTASTI